VTARIDRDDLAPELVALTEQMERIADGDPALRVIVAEVVETQRGRSLAPHVAFLCDALRFFLDALARRVSRSPLAR